MAENSTKIILTAEDRASQVLAGLNGRLQGLQTTADLAGRALGAIGVSLTGAAMVAMVKGTIDAADGFNDLAQRVGISVRELAGWTLAANQSGTSMEAVAKGVKGLSQFMVEHSDKLREAGITATDANGALVQLADLFAAMPDGVEKTALAVKLFGKAGMDMIPMLNQGSAGLAEAQEKAAAYGRKMAELAPMADKFNDEMAELAMQSKIAGMNITGFLLPGLIGMAKLFNDLKAGGERRGSALEFLDDVMPLGFGLRWQSMQSTTRSRGYGGPKNAQGLPPSAGDIAAQELAAFDAATAAYERDFAARKRAGKLLDKGKEGGAAAFKYKRDFDPAADFAFAIDEAQRKAARQRMIESEREMEALEEKARKMDEAHMARMEANRIEAEGEEAIRLHLEKTNAELAKQKNMADDLGLTFASAFEDAIVGGKGLQSILQGLAQDVARIFVRKTTTEPLANALSGMFKDMNIMDWFGGARAGGGPVESGTAYLVGERGPELFIPGQSGHIQPNAGGTGAVRIEVVNPPGRPAEVASATPRMDVDGMVVRVVLKDIATGGAIANAMASQFGLNRAAGAY